MIKNHITQKIYTKIKKKDFELNLIYYDMRYQISNLFKNFN